MQIMISTSTMKSNRRSR